jgi:predicted branched-subunit amino acid permease
MKTTVSKIINRLDYFFGFLSVGALLLGANIVYAASNSANEISIEEIITSGTNWVLLFCFLLSAYSLLNVFFRYVKRGGKKKWLILPALAPLAVLIWFILSRLAFPASHCCGHDGDYGLFFIFYIIILPLISGKLGGQKKSILWLGAIFSVLLSVAFFTLSSCGCMVQ